MAADIVPNPHYEFGPNSLTLVLFRNDFHRAPIAPLCPSTFKYDIPDGGHASHRNICFVLFLA
jgi:hypothetical protein